MDSHDKSKTPASPQEWFEAGISLRAQEQFGPAINAFRTAADLAAGRIASLRGTPASGPSDPDGVSAADFPQSESISETESMEELEKIRASSLAFIELINEIRAFVNTDLMNP